MTKSARTTLTVLAAAVALGVLLAPFIRKRMKPPPGALATPEAIAEKKPGPRLWIASAVEIYRIGIDASITPLNPKLNPTNDLGQVPVASPDQQRFAYTEANELAIVDPDRNTSTPITKVGQPENEEWASVEAVPLAWSRDARRLLYEVVHGPLLNENGTKLKTREADYGFKVLEIATGNVTPIPGKGEFMTWLPDDSLVVVPLELGAQRPLRLSGGELQPLIDDANVAGRFVRQQTDVSADGRTWIASIADPGFELRTRVLVFDIPARSSKTLVPLSEVGVAHQFPRFSPTGQHASLLVSDYRGREEQKSDAPIPSWVLVDGNRVFPPENDPPVTIGDVMWIDEQSLFIATEKSLSVFDWRARKVKSTRERASTAGP